jgi:RND family efflux transporter MFP subunit
MKTKLVLALLGAALLALVGYRVAAVKKASGKAPERTVDAALVTSARVVRADVAERVSLTGSVRPRNEVEVQPKVAGRVASVHAQVGDRVKPGQLLAIVEHEEIAWQAKQADAAVAVARAAVDGARLTAERTQKLIEGGSATPAQADDARVKLDLARAQLAQAQAAAGLAHRQLENARVVSPIAGTVTRRPVNVGVQVGLGTSLFTVQDMAALKLETSVDAAAFAKLARGQPAEVTVDARPGESYRGHVSLLSPALDPQSRRAAIEIEIDNAGGQLLPHMFAHADLTTGVARAALVVPKEALLDAPGGRTAFRLADGRAHPVQPRLGASDGARVVVLEGLAEGDEVATSGLAALSEGAPVKVAPAPGAARADAR